MGETLDDGLIFDGYIQPPDVPPDPTGNDWRGPPGPMGPVGPQGIPGPMPPGAPFLPLTGGTVTGPLYYTATGGNTPRSAQDRAADVANVLDFGADPTGVADSTVAIKAALLASTAVYMPAGTYRITDQLVIGAGRTFYGPGRASVTLMVSTDFNPSATGVLSLVGREQLSPIIYGFSIVFNQTTTQTSRANFLTLAAGGNLTTGIKYPPAVIITTSNRFRIIGFSVYAGWDGIINANGNNIGGFIIDNVEMGALNVGLQLDNCFDFGHVKTYHVWGFGFSLAVFTNVYSDGSHFGAKFGVNGTAEGINCVDWTLYRARLSIANSDSWLHFANLMMDGDNSTLEVSNCKYVQISNMYSVGSASGANTSALVEHAAGTLQISNIWTFSNGTSVNHTGGSLQITGGRLGQNHSDVPSVSQSGGSMTIQGLRLDLSTSTPWTVPVIAITNGFIRFLNNIFTSVSAGDVGGLVITTDTSQNVVEGNFWNGFGWGPPGILGSYGFNGTVSPSTMRAIGFVAGSPTATGAINLSLQGAVGSARQIPFYAGSVLEWNLAVNSSENFILARYAAGVFVGNPLSIDFATGILTLGPVNATSIGAVTPSAGTFTQLTLGTTSGPVIRVVTGVPAATLPKGSVSIRSDGAVGSTFYVTQGGGVWNAVAGV